MLVNSQTGIKALIITHLLDCMKLRTSCVMTTKLEKQTPSKQKNIPTAVSR